MKRWGIVLAALLLTAGCALADDSGFGLDNERAQAIYWEYSGAVIEDYAEVETAGRTFAFILFKQEQRRMAKVYFDSEFGWTDWFVTAEGVPQGGRGRLETDGESVTISAADGNGGLRTITYAWDAAMLNEPKGTVEDLKQFVGGFRLAAYDGARVDTDGVIHFAEGEGFKQEVAANVGCRKGSDKLLKLIDKTLKGISQEERDQMWDACLDRQPA